MAMQEISVNFESISKKTVSEVAKIMESVARQMKVELKGVHIDTYDDESYDEADSWKYGNLYDDQS